MLSFGNTNRRSKALSRRVMQRYTQKTKQGHLLEIHDDGNSKFDRVIDKLGDIKEGGRVCLASDKSCTGTVKWIGRCHVDPDIVVDEEYYIVGVKLDSMRGAYQHQCSYGDLDGEIVVNSPWKDSLFRGFPEWVSIPEQQPVFGMSARGASVAKKSKDITGNAEDTCDGLVRQSPQSKFDRFELDANGFHVGSRVKLDTGSVGTVKWIGCYHKKGVKLDDYIVGVELDSARKECASILTNGCYEGEQLVQTHKLNIKFTKLKHVCLLPTENAAAKRNSQGTYKTEKILNGYEIGIYHDGKSTFDRALSGMHGIQDGDRVYLFPDKTRTGTVKWIGCDHGRASETDRREFLVGVKMDNSEKDPGLLTDGIYGDQRLVDSHKKNIMFRKLKHWVLVASTGTTPKMVYDSKTQQEGAPKAEQTLDRTHVELYHDGKSAFDRVRYGIAGIENDDRVYLYSDKTRTGTVKWIGCYHNHAYKTNSRDFLVGVEMDKPEKEVAGALTDGTCCNEQLVISQKKNVVFIRVKYLTLIESEVNEAKQSTFTTLLEIPVGVSDDGESALASIRCGARVQLYSNQDRIGTVKWLGIHHCSTSKTDQKDYVVGVEMENPDSEPDDTLTDGTYCGQRLVNSQKRNVLFANLQYCALADQYCALADRANTKEETAKRMKSQPKERWSTVMTLDGIPIEIYNDGKSAFDRVRYGVAGIQNGDRVYLNSDKTRAGTVEWIGCNHGQASNTDPKDFFVGVEMDRPEMEQRGVLTDGTYCREQLVSSRKRNVMFVKLQWCYLVADSDMEHGKVNDTQTEVQEIYHDGKSRYNRVCSGIAGIQDGDRVQLYSDKTRTGTVRWLGCDHGSAVNTDPKDFLLGVEVDKPEKEKASALTYGNYYGEQLVTSSLKNVRFTKLKYWTLVDPERKPPAKDTKSQPSGTLKRETICNGYQIELYHDDQSAFDKVCSGVAGICDDNRVRLYSDKSITGTVKWIGCFHGTASETDHNDFLVGVQLDKPEDEYPSHPTDGTYYGERLVNSQNKNIVFTTLQYWSLAEQTDMRPAITDITRHHNDVPKSRQPSKKTNSSPIKPTPLTGHTKQTTHGNGTVCSPGAAVQSVPQQPIPAKALEKKAGADVYIENDHQKLIGMKEKVETEIGKLCSENVVASRNIRGDISHLPFSDCSEPSCVLSSNQVVRALEDESGAFDDFVNEYVLPPMHCEEYRGYWRGVQGDANSSYMDASLFAMFSYLTVFDSILFKGNAPSGHSTDEHIKRTDDIRSVLRTQIVNPLRKYGLAHQQGIRRLRRLLDEGCLSAVEKDPEEFLNHLLVEMFCTPSPIVLSDGQESHLFHLLEKKAEGMDFPTIQELVERTCLQQNVKFQKIPPYLILRPPTFGKDRKVYEKILPSLELDITDMLTESTQSCYVCGYAATHQCCGCYDISHKISESTFCSDCTEDYHKSPHRREHKPQKLVVADKGDGLSSPKCVLKLAAAICTKASHYVSFVATDTTADAKWYFFDNMADRDGATDVPQVTEIMGFRKHLRDAKSANNLPLPVRRLIKDGHMCLYVNPEVPQFKPTNAPLKIITPNGTSKV